MQVIAIREVAAVGDVIEVVVGTLICIRWPGVASGPFHVDQIQLPGNYRHHGCRRADDRYPPFATDDRFNRPGDKERNTNGAQQKRGRSEQPIADVAAHRFRCPRLHEQHEYQREGNIRVAPIREPRPEKGKGAHDRCEKGKGGSRDSTQESIGGVDQRRKQDGRQPSQPGPDDDGIAGTEQALEECH